MLKLLCFLLFQICNPYIVDAEVFSSISIMENLVSTQGKLLDLFDKYLKTQEENMSRVKKQIDSYKAEHEIAKANPGKYVNNPLNSFKIIKQLYQDWNVTLELMQRAYDDFQKDMKSLSLAEQDDIVGSVEGIIRLQHVYLLKTEHLAEGILDGFKCRQPLTSSDCFTIALETYNVKSHHSAKEWFEMALKKYDPEDYQSTTNLSTIMEFYANNEYLLGNIHKSLEVYSDLQQLDPYKEVNIKIETLESIVNNKTAMENIVVPKDPHTFSDTPYYEELCREALDTAPSVKKKLKCRYLRTQWPYTILGPFKVEEQYLQPYVAIYHDILYDSEIEYIMQEIRPKFKRAQVIETDDYTVAKTRISMNSWFSNDYSSIIIRINKRLEAMTGLNFDFAEQAQIANYGIGGFYIAHYDYFLNSVKKNYGNELDINRIATLLLYMTDVEQGGNTVFPNLGLSVKPRKGTAVFWYNLHPSGEGNEGTLHAACPVLRGSKWVLNKWVREIGNEFIKPCGLIFQDEGPCSNYTKFVPRVT